MDILARALIALIGYPLTFAFVLGVLVPITALPIWAALWGVEGALAYIAFYAAGCLAAWLAGLIVGST